MVDRCFYQLRQIRSVRRALTIDAVKTLVHAFIASRVDYCNAILSDVASTHLKRLQMVMNAAARLIVRRRRFDPIRETMLDELHWLPVEERVDYKLCLLVFKCLNNSAPKYLTAMCPLVSADAGRSHLRSAVQWKLKVSGVKTATFGARSFTVSAPKIWNQLPTDTRDPMLSSEQFEKKLKTWLFKRANNARL